MFIGGANQTADDGIRPPSVKGMLRFWWRALNWGRLRSQASCVETALDFLHAEESSLFGVAADSDGGGQGCFLLTVRSSAKPYNPQVPSRSGMAYMANMGLAKRNALPEGNDFTVALRFRPGTDPISKKNILEVMRLLSLVGGLGSRSRRGFGSVTRMMPDDAGGNRLPTQEEFEEDCKWLKSKIDSGSKPASPSPFSALDANALFYRSNSDYSGWGEALDSVGGAMNRYRTNGTASKKKDGQVIHAPTGKRFVMEKGEWKCVPTNLTQFPFFATDHNPVHAIAKSRFIPSSSSVPPRRAIFGIPHPYKFSSLDDAKVNFDNVPSWGGDDSKGRRASPLFVHIAAYTNGSGTVRYRPLLLLLPAMFLPATNPELSVSVNGSPVGTVPSPTDYGSIKEFLKTKFTAC